MKCPNCKTENLPISRFCTKCGKLLRLSRAKPSVPAARSPVPEKEPDEKVPPAIKPAKEEAKPPIKSVEEPIKREVKVESEVIEKPIKEAPKPDVGLKEKSGKEVIVPEIKPEEKPIKEALKPDTQPAVKLVEEESESEVIKLDGPAVKPAEKPSEKGKPAGIEGGREEKPRAEPSPPDSPVARGLGRDEKAKKKKKRPGFLLVIFLTLIALGIIIWLLFFRGSRGKEVPLPAAPETPSLAVIYFENNSGDGELDVWEQAIAHALITSLKQSNQIKVLSAERLFLILDKLNLLESQSYTSRDFQQIASLTGANHILSGNLSRVGRTVKMNSSLMQAVSGKALFSESFEGEGEISLFAQVDSLAKLINETFKVFEEGTSDNAFAGVSDITAKDPEVYTLYVQGRIDHFRHSYRRSIQTMDQVLAVDPGFALAEISKSESLYALGYLDKSWKESQMAQRLLEKLSERERFHLQGDFYRKSEKTYDIALKVYKRLLEIYPWDHVGNTRLGLLYKNMKQWDKAQECFQVNSMNKVRTENAYLGQAMVLAAQEQYEKAEEVLRSYLKLFSGPENTYLHMAALSLLQEKYQEALLAVEKGFSMRPVYYLTRMKGEIFMIRGDLAEAESEFQKLKNEEEPIAQLWGMRRLLDLYRLGGKFERAQKQALEGVQLAESLKELGWKYRFHMDLARMFLEARQPQRVLRECELAWNIAVQGETREFPREVLLYRGLAYLQMKRMDNVADTSTELKALCEKGPVANRMRYYLRLQGSIALAGGNYPQAIDQFSRAVALLPYQEVPWGSANDHAYFLNSLAAAYSAAGNTEKALENYGQIAALSTGRMSYGAIYARSLYMLGKLYADNGSQENAVAYFRRFFILWQEADPGNPEVDDARSRIAALQK